jgi:ribosome-associated protein
MNLDILLTELTFKAIRSSGPGGQHVNKTSSKVEVYFSIFTSESLRSTQKELLQERLAKRLNKEGVLILQCDETRSQHRNKKLVIDRLITLLTQNLEVAKPRKKSRPSRSAIAKRLKSKKNQSLKKTNRKRPPLD